VTLEQAIDNCRANIVPAKGKIKGDGSTFALPFYQEWEEQQNRQPGSVRVTYNSDPVGSEKGIELFCKGNIDFADSDWPLSPQQAGENVLQIPVALGAIVPVFQLSGVHSRLHFSRETLARIFGPGNAETKRIEWWDDQAIREDQKSGEKPLDIQLPHKRITVAHRAEGSGTTFAFLQFLHGSPDWTGPDPWFQSQAWPTPAKSIKGSKDLVNEVEGQGGGGAIGYVEYYYVLAPDRYGLDHQPDYGCILDEDRKKCVDAEIPSIGTAICKNIPQKLDALSRVNLLDMQKCTIGSSNENAYRISAFTFLLVPAHIPDDRRRQALQDFLRWILTDGQSLASGEGYAPLPHDLAALELKVVDSIRP
jgi:phosphate transport system substrate-binding protein